MCTKAALFLGGMVSGAAVGLVLAALRRDRDVDIDLRDLDLSQTSFV